MSEDESTDWVGEIKRIALVMGTFVALIWGIEIVDQLLFGGGLDRFGILPRRVDGLSGILVAPLLHGGWSHLTANTSSLLLFGGIVLVRSRGEFALVTAMGWLLGGLGVWLFGSLFTLRNAVHIGASGVIFAYFGYLLTIGLFERRFLSVLLSVAIAVTYGGVLFGVLPGQEGISWEAHLFGFLAGVAAARLVARRKKKREAEAKADPLGPLRTSDRRP
ncbi:MAG TPA: rhomboid family intramembrane serine protease [Polyangiaceae bacterium LLY-WYZ-15_(1-7)]|nr:rhomboid family intramembrane serine protease [Polyangiaceae bacterium LLY-WYZ-15_(1-7)]HJL05827.1 rhomboid family intramembrane serine protease [Polyangiaceae bacterium LLY-WYZ-15_(1-7)]HJL13893.1 rhomboid family intramembrane serine protease [Polyangiaceae bacterium LLY-WYZ-15_(1-7)]HJL23890.1 rhomboid family intramembrane serine protease [Polyangiaceae bacterium LLY-WYZ-15_(1-7)]HJL29496.1 rhomboid family intramembrane serine protease [Polyangiaceae bacterium LLY-WYZ-15_(1-7)]